MFSSLDCEYLRLETLPHFHYFLKWTDEGILENGLLHTFGGQVQPVYWGQIDLVLPLLFLLSPLQFKISLQGIWNITAAFYFPLGLYSFPQNPFKCLFRGFNSAFRGNQINTCLNALILSTTTKLFGASHSSLCLGSISE